MSKPWRNRKQRLRRELRLLISIDRQLAVPPSLKLDEEIEQFQKLIAAGLKLPLGHILGTPKVTRQGTEAIVDFQVLLPNPVHYIHTTIKL